ncbi:MAG TPA: SUMF1/EgtB/PvdO family nonheme iron enzyme [Polyangiaceae bacterium]|nr:SUMF1/EgtB/PvdO family nonheme iron enzyme [Polyangiaceae bacterium]
MTFIKCAEAEQNCIVVALWLALATGGCTSSSKGTAGGGSAGMDASAGSGGTGASAGSGGTGASAGSSGTGASAGSGGNSGGASGGGGASGASGSSGSGGGSSGAGGSGGGSSGSGGTAGSGGADAGAPVPPSCSASAPGAGKDCGPSSNELCCASIVVPSGSFNRSNNPVTPASVNSFRLDRFEVTVGRFRQFVKAVVAGYKPTVGAGKHTHLNGGAVDDENGADEKGWEAAWNSELPGTASAWDAALSKGNATWTSVAAANELRPINHVSWYHAYAFCIWDGGFLPTEAE